MGAGRCEEEEGDADVDGGAGEDGHGDEEEEDEAELPRDEVGQPDEEEAAAVGHEKAQEVHHLSTRPTSRPGHSRREKRRRRPV